MEVGFTLIVKFGERGLARKCSIGYTREELVGHLLTKWVGVTKEDIFLSYDLLGAGEMDLADEDDMATMFRLMEEMETRRVLIYCRRLSGLVANGSASSSSNSGKEVGQFNDDVSGGVGMDEGKVGWLGVQNLRSHEWRQLIVGPGQRFPDGAREFRMALIKYSVQMGFEFRFIKNDATRVTAACAKSREGCMWRIHAVKELSDEAFRISTYERTHNCDSVFGNVGRKRINYHMITEIILEDVRSMPCLTPVQIKALVKKNYGVDISYCVAWKAMDRGRSIVFGDHTTSFAMLPAYFAELVKANPGSHVDLDVGDDDKFRRCFFAFGASLLGFKQCRPILMVDGTFLKGRHRGVLLSAVGKDGDEGLFPLAFAVVNEETDDNWKYFFENLRCSVQESRRIVFISDRNHGILEGVKNIFPDSPHAFCYNHLKSNLEYRCRGMGKKSREVVLKFFQKCAYASSEPEFDENLIKMKNAGGYRAEAFLRDTPKEMWANAFFNGQRYGQMTSNACESWNAQIREEQMLPICSLIDGIRSKLMQQMCTRRQQAMMWPKKLCKTIDADMNLKVEQSRGWDVKKCTDDIWEVYSVPAAVVDLKGKSCTCRKWQFNGLPCVHAAAVILTKLNGKYEYVDSYFYAEVYKTVYSYAIVPFTKTVQCGAERVVLAPDYHQTRGRPKRRRIPSQGEVIPRKMKCGQCGQISNHNKKTCRSGRATD